MQAVHCVLFETFTVPAHVLIPDTAPEGAQEVEATVQASQPTAAAHVLIPDIAPEGAQEVEANVSTKMSKRAKKRLNQKKNRLERF